MNDRLPALPAFVRPAVQPLTPHPLPLGRPSQACGMSSCLQSSFPLPRSLTSPALETAIEGAAQRAVAEQRSFLVHVDGETTPLAADPLEWALEWASQAEGAQAGCICVCVDEAVSWNTRGSMVPSALARRLVAEMGMEARRWDGGSAGSAVIIRRPSVEQPEDGHPSPLLPVLCASAEHGRPSRAAAAAKSARPAMRRATGSGDGAAVCSACGYEIPPSARWLCDSCRTCLCSRCLSTRSLHHLPAATTRALASLQGGAVATADHLDSLTHDSWVGGVVLGEWPAVDERGRPFAWFVWTGPNEMPPYLQLCIDTFRRRAAAAFHVRLVRHHHLEELLGEGLHAAYELLSYVHRADYLRCELLHAYGASGPHTSAHICMRVCMRGARHLPQP